MPGAAPLVQGLGGVIMATQTFRSTICAGGFRFDHAKATIPASSKAATVGRSMIDPNLGKLAGRGTLTPASHRPSAAANDKPAKFPPKAFKS